MSRLGLKARIVGFVALTICIWLAWSLPPILAKNPEAFQAAGSIIVAWSILFYARDRSSREKLIQQHRHNAMILVANRLDARIEFADSLANNTADMHTLAYAKVLKKLGLQDSELGNTDQIIDNLEASYREAEEPTSKHSQLYQKLVTAETEATAAIELMTSEESVQSPWVRLLYNVELLFAAFGTLQWGYGNQWLELWLSWK